MLRLSLTFLSNTVPKLLGLYLSFLIYLFPSTSFTYAANLLQNGDFTSGNIDPWVSSGGGASASVVSEVNHNNANSLKVNHDKTSSYGFQQTITNIVGDKTYKVSGYGLTNDSNIKNFFIRVAWYASTDASGSQLSTEDTNIVTASDNQWHELTNTFQAPSNAKSAKTRLVLSSNTTASLTYAYFDDIVFEEPTQDILSPSPTPTPTPTSSPTPTPSSTPTPTATTTPSPSNSFTISNIPSEITIDQSFTSKVELTISGSPNTVYYLKGAFKKTDGTRYFGLTKKEENWIEYGDEHSEQYQITTDHNGSWSGSLDIKPDIYDKDYKGAGDYIFKVGRLTASGSSPTWSNEVGIKLNAKQEEIITQSTGTSSSTITDEIYSDSSSAVLAATSEDNFSSDSSEIAATTSEETSPIQVAGEKTGKPNFIVIVGAALIFIGIGSIAYLYFKNKVKF